jgi:dynein intermediate chain
LAGQSRITPLKSFEEFDDYVADVSWSPVHPAVFATVDASGTMNIFNINESDVPVGKVSTNKGLNKVDWNSNGDLVAAAGLDGTIDIFDTSMVVKTRSDDSQKFSQILREYQHN